MSTGRATQLERIRSDGEFDVIVVGGGVNGIGVYRELSLQGLRVLLVERSDFCSGCSAAPSRMIHGGLRYLENGEFDLVRESLFERDALLENAPHMVHPLPTVIPITSLLSGFFNAASQFLGRKGKPANRGALPIKVGLSLYDWVARNNRTLPRHKFLSADQTRRKWPGMTHRARCSAVYHDAWISHPERLCIEMLCDIRDSAPRSLALNYAQLSPAGEGYVVRCQIDGEDYPVTTRVLVNATGAWLDETVRSFGQQTKKAMVSGTKGSHLILRSHALSDALQGHMVYFENADGRVCIAFPYLDHVLVGSTDIRAPEAKRVRCEEDEKVYILDALRLVFPDLHIAENDIVFSYSGIRPLPTSDHDFTGRISRGHSVRKLDGATPQFCMIGGKWTTFRAFAEETTDLVLAELGHKRRCRTRTMQIGGGKNYPKSRDQLVDRLRDRFSINQARAEHLADHYGTSGVDVQQFSESTDGEPAAVFAGEYTASEIRHLIRTEFVETLSDIVLRRTSLAITGLVSLSNIDAIAEILADELALPPREIAAQRAALVSELDDYYGVSAETLTHRNKERSKECA